MKILFVCTHNRCRSILAEAALNHVPAEGIRGYSAGSQPSGQVHPKTLEALRRRGIATAGLASKSWDAFNDNPPDVVITVCDEAAGEACPLYLGGAVKAHWGVADPSRATGTESEIEAAFDATLDEFLRRATRVVERVQAGADQAELERELHALGRR